MDALMRRTAIATAVGSVLLLVNGCKLFGEQAILPPLSFQKQMAEVYRIAPKGTPREETVRRLKAAGITGEYAPHVDRQFEHNPSVFYCQMKNEGSKQRQMTVAVLFNERNELYAVTLSDVTDMPADISDSSNSRPSANATGSTATSGFPTRSTIPLPQSSEPTTPNRDSFDPRLGTRTPFGSNN